MNQRRPAMKSIIELLSKQPSKEEDKKVLRIDEQEIEELVAEELTKDMDVHSELTYSDISCQKVISTDIVVEDVNEEEKQGAEIALEDSTISQENILTSVFSDDGIMAVESPFRTFSDDRQEFGGSVSYVDLRKVIQKYQNGEITDRILKILDIIIQHKNITSRQIWQMYMLKYHRYIKREHLKRTLDHMVDDGLIGQFRIASAEGKSLYYIYAPEYNGVRLYSAIEGESINWRKTDAVQKSYNVKRCLATNQFLIAFLKHYEVEYKLHERLAWINDNGGSMGGVRPSLELTFKQGNENGPENIVFLVEVIRRYQGWEEQFKNKLERYAGYLKSVEDTQKLKKYYIIVCAESDEQLEGALSQFYEVVYVKRVRNLRDSMFYFISDIDLLDGNVKEDLLYNLHGMVYDFEKKAWKKHSPNFTLIERDWHNFSFEIDVIRNDENMKRDVYTKDEKEELAIQIYNVIVKGGYQFPVPIKKVAQYLKWNGIDYQEMGYKRLKQMFTTLSKYYELNYASPTELIIAPTEDFRKLLGEDRTDEENLDDSENVGFGSEANDNETEELHWGSSLSMHQTEDEEAEIDSDIIAAYIINGMAEKRKWSQQLRNDIFCKNWDMTATILNKITKMRDFTAEGWYNIIAYSFQIAKVKGRLRISGKYLCFDTGLRSYSDEKVYFLAEKNTRMKPEWVLLGITTENSKSLGELIKKEFGASN